MRGKFDDFRVLTRAQLTPGDLVMPAVDSGFSAALVAKGPNGTSQVPLDGEYAFHLNSWGLDSWIRLGKREDLVLDTDIANRP